MLVSGNVFFEAETQKEIHLPTMDFSWDMLLPRLASTRPWIDWNFPRLRGIGMENETQRAVQNPFEIQHVGNNEFMILITSDNWYKIRRFWLLMEL